jgi:hypothetical protein
MINDERAIIMKMNRKKIFTQLLPKYFKRESEDFQEKPVIIVPSLVNLETLKGNISLDLSQYNDDHIPKKYLTSSDYEAVYLSDIKNDAISFELLRFLAKVNYCHKLQVESYMLSYCETLVDIVAPKLREKALNKVIIKLQKLNLIRKMVYSGSDKTPFDVPIFSLTGEGYRFVKHLRSQLGINYFVTSPDNYLEKVPRAFARAWSIVDVFLASLALKNFRGFESHFTGFSDEEKEYPMPVSNCVLTLELSNQVKTTLFTYTFFENDNPNYLKQAIQGWTAIASKYSNQPIPNFNGEINLFSIIVQNRELAELINQQFGLSDLPYPPVLIVLEMMQDQSIEDAFVFWDENGEISKLALTAKKPFKESKPLEPIKTKELDKKYIQGNQNKPTDVLSEKLNETTTETESNKNLEVDEFEKRTEVESELDIDDDDVIVEENSVQEIDDEVIEETTDDEEDEFDGSW